MLRRYRQDFDEEILTGQWTLDLVGSRTRLPVDLRYVLVRRVPYAGGAPAPAWVYQPSRRRVCLTLGVSGQHGSAAHAGRLVVADLLDMVADLEIELVATLNAAQLTATGEVPANVRLVDYLPLTALLPTCAAVVHHGGGGTYATAVAHRVPQLIAPVPKWDEAATAAYVAARGAGLVGPTVGADDFSVDVVREQLGRLLDDPVFQAGAAALHEDMLAAPSPRETVSVLGRLTAEHRRGVPVQGDSGGPRP